MSFCFTGIDSLAHFESDDDDEIDETSKVSSLMEDDLLTDNNDEDEDIDNNINADNNDDDDDDVLTNPDNEISAISGLSNASSKKRMDVFIQTNASIVDIEKLYAYECTCKKNCTQNVSVAQIIKARDIAWGGQCQISAAVRRQRTFEIVRSGNWITSRSKVSKDLTNELRYITYIVKLSELLTLIVFCATSNI